MQIVVTGKQLVTHKCYMFAKKMEHLGSHLSDLI